MVLGPGVKFKVGMLSQTPNLPQLQTSTSFVVQCCGGKVLCCVCADVCRDRVVQAFLAADEEEKRRMEVMYGAKILHKLLENWRQQEDSREYIQQHTVLPSNTPNTPSNPSTPSTCSVL